MANLSSIARPYALAAFEYARENQQLPAWKAFLEAAKIIATNASVAKLLNNPEILSTKLFDLFHDVLASLLNPHQNNFLLQLAQNKRLDVLPEITDTFNAYYATFEKMSTVKVVTAIDIDQAYREKLAEALTKRVHHQVTLDCKVDPSILGGAIVYIGNRVIDDSIRGKLTRLLEFSLR